MDFGTPWPSVFMAVGTIPPNRQAPSSMQNTRRELAKNFGKLVRTNARVETLCDILPTYLCTQAIFPPGLLSKPCGKNQINPCFGKPEPNPPTHWLSACQNSWFILFLPILTMPQQPRFSDSQILRFSDSPIPQILQIL